ncbi:MAG: murein transglycosylase A [Moraxellaceae bacterium]
MRSLFLVASLTLLLAACSSRPPAPAEKPVVDARYIPAEWSALPGWPGDQLSASWEAWLQSCKRLQNRADWKALCVQAQALQTQAGSAPDDAAIRAYFENGFQPWQIENTVSGSTGLITGYYEALLKGSREAKPGSVPLYGVPDDMLTIELGSVYPDLKSMRLRGRVAGNKVLPYWSRADIDAGRAALPSTKVLAWADNAVDAFFMEVQGSGRVQLEDGSMIRLGYADQNGQPYKSIGRWLVDQGEMTLDQASMQSIRAWAEANPQRLPELLAANPSYVFFRIAADASGGPIGALNVPLTDGASMAVDPKFIPLGSPVFLATTRPDNGAPLNRLMQAQDTGGAIRGPVRGDFFWGFGAEAAATAGKMKQKGQLWLLRPKGMSPPELKAP